MAMILFHERTPVMIRRFRRHYFATLIFASAMIFILMTPRRDIAVVRSARCRKRRMRAGRGAQRAQRVRGAVTNRSLRIYARQCHATLRVRHASVALARERADVAAMP